MRIAVVVFGVLAAALAAGCNPGGNPPDIDNGPTGALNLALSPSDEATFDVAEIRFRVTSLEDNTVQERTVPLRARPGVRPEANWLLALSAGDYEVSAEPLMADRAPSEVCQSAQGTTTVVVGQTASLLLTLPCAGEGSGGLDIGAELTAPPHIEEIEVVRGGTRLCRGEVLELEATVRDPSAQVGREPVLEYEVSAEPGEGGWCLRAQNQRAAFASNGLGLYTLSFSAANDSGESALEIPIEVMECEVPQVCVGDATSDVIFGVDTSQSGACQCEPEEDGEPVVAVVQGELVVTPTQRRDQLQALAMHALPAANCAGDVNVGYDTVLRVARPGLVEVQAEAVQPDGQVVMALLGEGGELDCQDGAGQGVRQTYDLAAGLYRVRVWSRGEAAPVGLKVEQKAAPVPVEANGEPVPSDNAEGMEVVAPCAATSGLARVFAVGVQEEDVMTFRAVAVGLDNLAMWITDGQGAVVDCNDDTEGTNPVLTQRLAAGRYRLFVGVVDGQEGEVAPFTMEATGLTPLEMEVSGVDGLLEATAIDVSEFELYAHQSTILRMEARSPGVAQVEATGPDGQMEILEPDATLNTLESGTGVWSFVGLDAQGDRITRTTSVNISPDYVAPGVVQRGAFVTNTVRCSMRERYDVPTKTCAACGSNGYQDPDDATLCRSCPPPQVVRWRQANNPNTLLNHPVPGAEALCICPEHTIGQPGFCQERCPDGEYWDPQEQACSTYPVGDPNSDDDGDGLDNATELGLGTNPANRDSDGDSVDDGVENAKGFNPLQGDSDGDGLTDGVEYLSAGTNPLLADTDGDGLSDGDEHLGVTPTSALLADTDGDGLTDGEEVNVYNTRPNLDDSDGDTLNDCTEVQDTCNGVRTSRWRSSDPLDADTDGDKLLDPFERAYNTDPRSIDTDSDGIDDQTEIRLNLNATSNCSCDMDLDGRTDNDADGDTLTDADEYINGFGIAGIGRVFPAPWKRDTDGDGIDDNREINGWRDSNGVLRVTDPTRWDTDGDRISDNQEGTLGTDPRDTDTDNDGLTDGEEVLTYNTDPTRLDEDGDGLEEWKEILRGLDPKSDDTDGDGIKDGVDLDPRNPANDQDGDGLGSAQETALGLDPQNPDSDGDGLGDFEEVRIYRTWPLQGNCTGSARDCDGDQLFDGFEVNTIGSDPRKADTDGDGDGDYQEWAWTGSGARVTTPTVTFGSRNNPKHTADGGYGFFRGTAFPPDDAIDVNTGRRDPQGLRSISKTTVDQGGLGDCWFMAPMLSIAEKEPGYLRKLITAHPDGTYTVKLYRNNKLEPVYTRLDALFPRKANSAVAYAQPVFVKVKRNINGVLKEVSVPTLFGPLLEKAAARLRSNNYAQLHASLTVLGISTGWVGHEFLTGLPTSWTWGMPIRTPIYQSYFERSDKLNRALTFSTFFPASDCFHEPSGGDPGQPLANLHVYAYTGETTNNGAQFEIWNPWNIAGRSKVGDLRVQRVAHCFIGGTLSSRVLSATTYVDKPVRP